MTESELEKKAEDLARLIGAWERLEAIVAFFETRCENCTTHYCESCTERLGKMIVEAAEFLAESEHE